MNQDMKKLLKITLATEEHPIPKEQSFVQEQVPHDGAKDSSENGLHLFC